MSHQYTFVLPMSLDRCTNAEIFIDHTNLCPLIQATFFSLIPMFDQAWLTPYLKCFPPNVAVWYPSGSTLYIGLIVWNCCSSLTCATISGLPILFATQCPLSPSQSAPSVMTYPATFTPSSPLIVSMAISSIRVALVQCCRFASRPWSLLYVFVQYDTSTVTGKMTVKIDQLAHLFCVSQMLLTASWQKRKHSTNSDTCPFVNILRRKNLTWNPLLLWQCCSKKKMLDWYYIRHEWFWHMEDGCLPWW